MAAPGPSLTPSRYLPNAPQRNAPHTAPAASRRATSQGQRRVSGQLSAYEALDAPAFDNFVGGLTTKIRASLEYRRPPVKHTKARASLPADSSRDVFGSLRRLNGLDTADQDSLDDQEDEQTQGQADPVYPRLPSFEASPPPATSARRQPLALARSSSEGSEDDESLPSAPSGPEQAADDVIEIGSSDEDEPVQRPGDRAQPEYSDEEESAEEEYPSEEEEAAEVDELQSSPVRPGREASADWDDQDEEEDYGALSPVKRIVDKYESSPDEPEQESALSPTFEQPISPVFEQPQSPVFDALDGYDDFEEPWEGIGAGDVMDVDGATDLPVIEPAFNEDALRFLAASALLQSAQSDLIAVDQPQPDSGEAPVPVFASATPTDERAGSPTASDSSLEYIQNPFELLPAVPVPVAAPTIASVTLPVSAAPLVAPAGFDDYDEELAARPPSVKADQAAAQPSVAEPAPAQVEAATPPQDIPVPQTPLSSAHLEPEPTAPRSRLAQTMLDRMRHALDAEQTAALYGPDESTRRNEIVEIEEDDDELEFKDERTAVEKAEDDAAREEERYFDDEEPEEVSTARAGSS